MSQIVTCKKCGEQDMSYSKTGASIDGKYYCQTCYDEIISKIEDNCIKESLND